LVIVILEGGIGNQLFQYTAAKKISLQTGSRLILNNYRLSVSRSHRKFFLNQLNINDRIIPWPLNRILQNKPLLNLKPDNRIIKLISDSDPKPPNCKIILMSGYFMNKSNIIGMERMLNKNMVLVNPSSQFKTASMRLGHENSISIHIRRGDYVSNTAFGTIGPEYYRRAMDFMVEKVENPLFCVFSDEPEWVKSLKQFWSGRRVFFVHEKISDLEELFLMSSCHHQIIANSTYSCWAAYLNSMPGKIVIRPETYFSDSKLSNPDIFPDDWISIPNDFASWENTFISA
jgi:hypothetical protein